MIGAIMKKLIKYLNDYEKWKGEEYGRGNYVWGIDKENKNIFASRFPDLSYICEEESRAIIICKGYNFIKRLVDNDKIDLKEFHKLCGIINQDSEYWNGTPQDYEQVIMYLSISDYPIEDLVSILK